MAHRVLIVEDDSTVREQLAGALEDEGFNVGAVPSVAEALESLAVGEFDLIITDLRLPDGSGLKVVETARESQPDCPVLVVTAYASVDTAVEAMRRGAFHYLSKPFSLDGLLVEVEKAVEHGRLLRERRALRERLSAERGLGKLLGESPLMRQLGEMIRGAAAASSTVLITGETGTGKELVANAVHYESARAGGPLVKVNCAALTESLLESELFGHERGAFTGAEKSRAGRFERADGGTLFLDEITEMGAHVQAKLLRVLQGDPFERVGGEKPIEVDVRIVAATNRDPEGAVAEGKLRQDLYYRLNVVRLDVPPLRDRREDIPLLAELFLSASAARAGREASGITPEALEALARHDWPGNVRELENCIERALIMCHGGEIAPSDLPPPLSAGAEAAGQEPDTLNLKKLEERALLGALSQSGWNKAQAAKALGIYPASLYKKMKRFGISLERPEE